MSEQNTGSSRFSETKQEPKQKSSRFANTSGNSQKKKVNYRGGYGSGQNEENYFLLVVGFVFLILPLIVHATVYDPKLWEFDWFSSIQKSVDVFLYYKQWIFTGILFIMLFCFAGSYFNGKRKFLFTPMFIPLGIYALVSILSTIFSKYRSYGVNGIFEQFESIFCLVGYAVIVYFIYMYVRREKDVRALINVLAFGALIIGLIGTLQGFASAEHPGFDLFRSSFGKSLIASNDVPAENLSFSFELGRAYVTLYNPNYVGVYCTLIIPVFTVLIPYAKKLWERCLYIAVVVTLLISMFAAQFKAGIVSLVMVGLVILVLLRKTLIKRWYITAVVVVGVIAMFITVDTVNGHNYSNSIKEAFKIEKSAPHALTEIETEKDHIKIVYNEKTYFLRFEGVETETSGFQYGNITLEKEDGTFVKVQNDANDATKVVAEDKNLSTLYFHNTVYDLGNEEYKYVLAANIDGKDWNFVKNEEGYKYWNLYQRDVDIETADTAVFDGYEGLASRRGFIWARTIPLLKKYLFLGSGADTFSIVFPQHDYVSYYNNGYEGQLISKPHCWYLQVAVQTGVLSLIAILVFYGMYFVQCIRLYSKRNFDSYLSQTGVAIFVGTIGYMIAAITNDSSITVAPVFWALIGLGIAVNAMVKEEEVG